jgi:hypothetical protein
MLWSFGRSGHFLWRVSCVADGVGCDRGDGVGGGVGATELCFIGATLQLRGAEPVSQPLVAQSGNVLVYNGNAVELRRVLFFPFFGHRLMPSDIWHICC